eukprot:TRINITY_DN11260_c0_g1_i1.p1 TRINITY_DN11260_c0_g1~~TRINITY_DN11260_c0_g1_i1.p1  ORF type:complete len:435 (+),score=83.53 TRINITY_DN11260_c0_g1_i1:420-1724(+)
MTCRCRRRSFVWVGLGHSFVAEEGMSGYKYPCTGPTYVNGFGSFVTSQLENSTPRHNLTAFAKELEATFGWPRISLTNSGSSANLAAALTLSEIVQTRKLGRKLTQVGRPSLMPVGRVLTAGFTFPSTMAGLQAAGFEIYLVDTEAGGFCMCPDALLRAIESLKNSSIPPAGVCVTHFLGFPAQLKRIQQICREHDLVLLQDACETMTLTIDGTPAHLFGDISAWSFYHPHHLSSFGGGAVSSPHPEFQRITESITHWGRLCTCHFNPRVCTAPESMHHHFNYVRPGHNLEMSELNACFGRFQLMRWEQDEAKRIRHYDTLYSALKDIKHVKVWARVPGCGSPFVFPIALDVGNSEYIKKEIMSFGVELRSLMGGGIHEQPAWSDVPNDGLSNCKYISSASFFVGIHQTLNHVDQVAAILKRKLKSLQLSRSKM